jgi:NAD(P)-dependent dehydrogenase (short-subunit alcohol dehydrogenase family)
MPLKGLTDKVVIVTGGASGIGRATARRLIDEGARVAIVDVNAESVARTADELGEQHVLGVTADVSVPADVDRYFDAAIERFGKIDGLFNNAGIAPAPLTLAEFEPDAFLRVFHVNVLGTFLGIRKALNVFAAQGTPGAIVNTASGLALRAVEQQGPYAASKAAVVSLTKTAAREAGSAGVRVNALLPGPTETPMYLAVPEEIRDEYAKLIPLGRMGQPEEQAAMAAWLLSEESSFVTGAIYLVDGGEGS